MTSNLWVYELQRRSKLILCMLIVFFNVAYLLVLEVTEGQFIQKGAFFNLPVLRISTIQ